MNVTYLREKPIEFSGKCPSSDSVPGEDFIFSSRGRNDFGINGRVLKGVPDHQVLVLDTCGGGRLKIVSDDCQYVVPADHEEWELVKPIIKELTHRRVLVLSEVSYNGPDLQIMKETCRNSFYSSDGALISDKFSKENYSPEKMAEVGLKFVGCKDCDITVCYFNPEHQNSVQRRSHGPNLPHNLHFKCWCFDNKMYQIPVLSTEDGQIIPAKVYKVSLHDDHSSRTCDNLFLITHSAAPIKITPLSEVMPEAGTVRLTEFAPTSVGYGTTLTAIMTQHFNSLKQLFFYNHFSCSLIKIRPIKHDFITQLREYRTQLHTPADLATADALLDKLESSDLLPEVREVVDKLASLQLVKEHADMLSFLPPGTCKELSSNMALVAKKELQKLADSYEQRYFVNDFLNGLVKDGMLGCLFTSNYFNTSKRCDTLMSLLDKGAEFTQALASISEAIRELLGPFMDESAEPCDLQVKDIA